MSIITKRDEPMNAIAVMTGIVVAGFAGGFLLLLLHAFAVWVLWGWFLVPLGVPPIGIAWAIGLVSLASLFQYMPPTPAPPVPAEQEKWTKLAGDCARAPVALAIGWAAKQFM
jgi:hypothetical protein